MKHEQKMQNIGRLLILSQSFNESVKIFKKLKLFNAVLHTKTSLSIPREKGCVCEMIKSMKNVSNSECVKAISHKNGNISAMYNFNGINVWVTFTKI